MIGINTERLVEIYNELVKDEETCLEILVNETSEPLEPQILIRANKWEVEPALNAYRVPSLSNDPAEAIELLKLWSTQWAQWDEEHDESRIFPPNPQQIRFLFHLTGTLEEKKKQIEDGFTVGWLKPGDYLYHMDKFCYDIWQPDKNYIMLVPNYEGYYWGRTWFEWDASWGAYTNPIRTSYFSGGLSAHSLITALDFLRKIAHEEGRKEGEREARSNCYYPKHFLTRIQYERALALAKCFHHDWATFVLDWLTPSLLEDIQVSEMLIHQLMLGMYEKSQREGRWWGITSPDLDEDGNAVHTTERNRLSWRIENDGRTTITVHRPDCEKALAAIIPGEEAQEDQSITILAGEAPLHMRHWRSLLHAVSIFKSREEIFPVIADHLKKMTYEESGDSGSNFDGDPRFDPKYYGEEEAAERREHWLASQHIYLAFSGPEDGLSGVPILAHSYEEACSLAPQNHPVVRLL